jgi:membrane protease YdiL (CAAX protease family)
MVGPASSSRRSSLLALLLIAPAPSIGAYMMFWSYRGETLGSVAYTLGKVILYGLPVVWLLFVDRQRLSLSRPERGGFGIGIALGFLISACIFATYSLFAKARIDASVIQRVVDENGLGVAWKYIAACIWLATVNALLEEYVFRWFIYTRCEAMMAAPSLSARGAGGGSSDLSTDGAHPHPSPPPLRGGGKWLAVILAGLIFTAHHVIVLKAYFEWDITLLASAGIFMGGCAWSALYLRYRSIWPGYVSHVIVDVAVFVIGWDLIFRFTDLG